MKSVKISVPDEMHEAIKKIAQEQDRSVANFMLRATRVECNRHNAKLLPIDTLRQRERATARSPGDERVS